MSAFSSTCNPLGGQMKQKEDATKAGYVGNTSRFQTYGDPLNDPLYDDGEFIVVNGRWIGDNPENSEEGVACRWYGFDPTLPEEEQGKGYPNGFGRAQWMVLPKYLGYLLIKDHLDREMVECRP